MEKEKPAPTPNMAEAILTFADHLGSELVDIIAGKEEKCFTVHKDLLVSTCDYLRKILYSGANGKRSYIDFKAEDTGAVSLLVTFIYRGSVPTSEEYIAEIKAKEHRISNVKAQNTSSYFPAMKFSVFQPSRPITSQNLSETRSSPFGKLSALAALTTPSSPSTFGVPQAPKTPSIFRASTPIGIFEPKSPQHKATAKLYQITLLRLCILAERMACPAIFNAAIRSYNEGEVTAGRSTPIEHARLIYGKSAANSTLRDMILDGIYNLGEDGLDKCMTFASEDKNFFRALCTRSLRPKQEFNSVVEALNNGAYDLVEKEPVAFGGIFQLPATSTQSKSNIDASSGENSFDAKMEE